ncbi:hypothetical protein V2J09_008077 [Rumex salicifolius]
MAAESAILVGIATSLASGILTEVAKKAIGAASESSTVAGLRSAIFRGLDDDLRLLNEELRSLGYVLSNAQGIDCNRPTAAANYGLLLIWLGEVKEAAFYADNLLDEIAYEKTRRKLHVQTSPFASLFTRSDTSFLFRVRIGRKIKKFASLTAEIRTKAESTLHLTQLAGNASTATNQPPPTVDENLRGIRENPDTLIVMGREADEKLIVNSLCNPHNGLVFSVVAIVGRSGVGKTTLARLVYDNKIVEEHFGIKTWIFDSDNFRIERFLDEMLQKVTGKVTV